MNISRVPKGRQVKLDSAQSGAPVTPLAPEALSVVEAVELAEEEALQRAMAAMAASVPSAARVLLEPFALTSVRVETLIILGKTRFAEGDLDAALEILTRAEALHPMERAIWKTFAEIYSTRGQYHQELAYRRKLVYLVAKPRAEDYVALVKSFVQAAKEKPPTSIQELTIAIKNLPTAPGTSLTLQLELAERLYSVKKLSQHAVDSYTALCPPKAEERDVTATWIGLEAWCDQTGSPLHRRFVEGGGEKEAVLAELKDVVIIPSFQWMPVVGNGAAVLERFVMHRMKPRREVPSSPQLMHNGKTLLLRLQREMRVVPERALLLGGMPQYYHNTIDFLSSLAVAESLQIGLDLPLVVNDDLAPFQLEQLALLGYTEERLIRVKAEEQIRFLDLLVPMRLVRGGQWIHPLLPHWYRSRLVSAHAEPPSRKLYVSRRLATRRRVTNESEVSAALEDLGYETVYPEELSVREQIDLFSQATHVVAPGGAALTNQIFMPPGGQVLALTGRYVLEGLLNDTYFDPLAVACGHRFAWLQGRAREFHSVRLIDADYEIDISELREALVNQPGVN